jgi:hypothetical protein
VNLEVFGDSNPQTNSAKIADMAGEIGDELVHVSALET